jgi:hypothetical protein
MIGFETSCSTSERIIWNDAAAKDDSYPACEKFIGVQPVLTTRLKNLIRLNVAGKEFSLLLLSSSSY